MNGHSEQAEKTTVDVEEVAEVAVDQETQAVEETAAEEDPLAVLQAKADENWNSYLRSAAELENVRKRSARDVENARKFALERINGELLAVRDSLELGLASSENADADQLRAGSEATLKLLISTLERFGVTELDPQGEPFDPELHEAMTMQASSKVEPGSVLEVFQKGYSLNGRLLRPALVVVAEAPPGRDGSE